MSGSNTRRRGSQHEGDTRPDGSRREAARQEIPPRAQLPLLDRLIDESPDELRDPPMSSADALTALRLSVRRDLEALLNARRRWRSLPPQFSELPSSAIAFGIPEIASGELNDGARRESLRQEIEASIRRFEPRLRGVRVSVAEAVNNLEPTLRLRIDAVLQVQEAREEVVFDTAVDPTTADVYVVERQ